MTSATETRFYLMTPPVMQPEDVRKASERMMNLWLGAMSPLWAPFWAASSFGVGVWAVSHNLKPAEGLLTELPAADGWLSLFRSWGLEAGELHEKAVEAVGNAAEKAESPAEKASVEAAPAEAVAVDPVTEAPVVTPEAAPEPVAPEPVAPKPIARAVSAARKPRAKT